jgi:hypothetical protein
MLLWQVIILFFISGLIIYIIIGLVEYHALLSRPKIPRWETVIPVQFRSLAKSKKILG